MPVFTVLNLERCKVYVTPPYIHFFFIASLLEKNLWTSREAMLVCESQLAEADQALYDCYELYL